MFKQIKKFSIIVVVLAATTLTTGCNIIGEKVEVGPTEVAKIMTKDGYQEGVIPTSKFRLASCFVYCDSLVKMDVSDQRFTEKQVVFMPKDKLQMGLTIGGTIAIDPSKIEPLFGKVAPVATNDGYYIGINRIYDTYAEKLINTTAREYITQFSIAEVSSSLERMNTELYNTMKHEIETKTPFKLRSMEIVSTEYPKVITDAQENAAKRREMIQQEEAQLEISKVQLDRELQEAELRRKIDLERAKGEAAAQKLQAEVITDKVLELRKLENERMWIERWDGRQPTMMVQGQSSGMLMQIPTPQTK